LNSLDYAIIVTKNKMEKIIYALISVSIVTILSLLGVVFIFMKENSIQKILKYFVAFSAGAFLGEVVFHLLPQSTESFNGFPTELGFLILLGFIAFFIIEKAIHWRHCHNTDEGHIHSIGKMNLIGDLLHNFIDGLIIGASFIVSIPLGITTTTAIILHEIPQEIGNFGILLHSGYSKNKALLLNFLVGLTAILGTIISLIIGSHFQDIIKYLIPITAGGFLYMATVDLIPELKEEAKLNKIALQFSVMIIGIILMYLMLFLE